MKLLHFADLHLGIEQYGSIDPETGLSSRLSDVLKVLDELVDYSLKSSIDVVLFCGDAYKSRDPSQTQQRELAKRIKRLSEAGIPTFLLVGNHDLPVAPGRATTLDIFHTLDVSNVYVASRPAVQVINTRTGPVQIAALPWLRRSALLSKEESRGLSVDQVLQRLQEVLTATVANLAESLNPALPAILAAHASVSTAKVSSERTMSLGKEPVLLLSNIALPVFDYVALGHVHKHQVLSGHPPTVYSGSLERVDFGEEQDDKGFYVIDIEPGQSPGSRCAAFDFHRVAARPFITIQVELDTSTPDPTHAIMEAIRSKQDEARNAVVRVEINCAEGIAEKIRETEVREALRQAHNLSIVKNIGRIARTRLGNRAPEELSPIQALELYLESKKVPPERKKVLLEYAERLITDREAAA
ncbi:MAG: exonuclease SbcCD subunit D [Chloroflexi bacterium]|nr:exonuclease SbcCD subunit D [Chloroflexota bacterium]